VAPTTCFLILSFRSITPQISELRGSNIAPSHRLYSAYVATAEAVIFLCIIICIIIIVHIGKTHRKRALETRIGRTHCKDVFRRNTRIGETHRYASEDDINNVTYQTYRSQGEDTGLTQGSTQGKCLPTMQKGVCLTLQHASVSGRIPGRFITGRFIPEREKQLAHVPVEDVLDAFEELATAMPQQQGINELLTYFEHIHIYVVDDCQVADITTGQHCSLQHHRTNANLR